MKYRKLRIAWTVGCGILCLLLILVWVRSYTWRDMVWARNPDWGSTYAMTLQGKLRISLFREHRHSPSDFALWGASSAPADRMAADLERSPMPKRVSALGFELVNYPNPFAFAVPFWFLVPMSIVSAALPFIPWRFRLRTLLIATTLIAVLLGIVIWAAK